jgi:hypothetical protein
VLPVKNLTMTSAIKYMRLRSIILALLIGPTSMHFYLQQAKWTQQRKHLKNVCVLQINVEYTFPLRVKTIRVLRCFLAPNWVSPRWCNLVLHFLAHSKHPYRAPSLLRPSRRTHVTWKRKNGFLLNLVWRLSHWKLLQTPVSNNR